MSTALNGTWTAVAQYPIEQRPFCVTCRHRMFIERRAPNNWRCGRCKRRCREHEEPPEPGPAKQQNRPARANRKAVTIRFNHAVPLEIRPWCRTCKQVCIAKFARVKKQWVCRGCGWARVVSQTTKPPGVPRLKLTLKRGEKDTSWEQQIYCIRHHSRMYRKLDQAWGCWRCDKKHPPVSREVVTRIPHLERLFPSTERPHCIYCQYQMKPLELKRAQWTCRPCDNSCLMEDTTLPDLRPCCLECQSHLTDLGLSNRKRRWRCNTCDFSFYGEGKGKEQKPIVKPTPEYLAELRALASILGDLARRYPEQPFNERLIRFQTATRYQVKRTIERDRKAVAHEIDRHDCCTADEIAEAVHLTEREITMVCEDLVKHPLDGQRYEWRPISTNTDVARGTRSLGIFPVDAPTVIKPIMSVVQRPEFFNVDRMAINSATQDRRRVAAGG